jgi:hypothetical protein
MSAINFPISTLRREGTNLKPLDNKLFCDVVKILDDLLLIADIQTWERRMRLREYFFDDKDQDQDQEYSKFKK